VIALLFTALGAALLTWLVGWWGVVIAGLIAGAVLSHRRGVAWVVALAAVMAWCALILGNAIGGRFATLASSIAGVMRVPPALLIVVTLLFGALLAWSAAVLGSEIGRAARRERTPM
jgi:hypothetical protein